MMHSKSRRAEHPSRQRAQRHEPSSGSASGNTAAAVASNLQQQVHLLELEIHARRREAASMERDRSAEAAIVDAGRSARSPPVPPQSTRFAARTALGRHAAASTSAGEHRAGKGRILPSHGASSAARRSSGTARRTTTAGRDQRTNGRATAAGAVASASDFDEAPAPRPPMDQEQQQMFDSVDGMGLGFDLGSALAGAGTEAGESLDDDELLLAFRRRLRRQQE